MKKFLLLPGIFLLFLTLFAAGCTAKQNSVAVTPVQLPVTGEKKLPESAMILLYDRETVTVNPDGTYTCSDECRYKVLNYEGLKQLQKLTFHFNTSYGTLQITHLALVKPDGRKIIIDAGKNSVVSTESSQLDSAIFDPAQKVLTVTVPGLETGDILEVTTLEKQTKPRLPGHFSDIAVLQADFPIEYYEYIVDMPENKPLNFIIKDEVPGTVSFNKETKDGRIIYRWQAKNVPLLTPEPAMPQLYTCAQRILTSTVDSWEDISRWYDALCTPRLAKVNAAMKEKTAELTAGKKSDMEKITALFQFVSQQIRYTGVTDEESAPGYEPHDVDKTFNQKHGVCRDKAALLVAMLRLAGFKAYPTLFMSGTPKDPEIANIYFNHAIVAVENAPDKYILMDPTFETTTELFPGYLAGDSFLVAKPEGDTLRTAPPVKAESNLLEITTVAGKESGKILLKFSGIYDNMYRSAFSQWSPEDIRSYFASGIRSIMPGADLTGIKIEPENIRDMSKELAAELNFKLPPGEFSDTAPNPVNLPRSALKFGNMNSFLQFTALKSRRFPLRVMPRAVRESITMEIAPGFEVNLPPAVNLQKDGLYRLRSSSTFAGNRINEEFFLALDSMQVSPQDYPEFRTAGATARKINETLPLAVRDVAYSTSGADVEILNEERFYNLIDENNWDFTVKTAIRVLNYAGMKAYSNITIPFVEMPEISGTVTDSKGQKYPITAKDIQYMDDETTAGAPRYAKRRLAVITLPGVDVNSTIELEMVHHIRERRGFFTTFSTQEKHAPARKRELIIEHPAKMKLNISAIPEQIRDSATFGGKRIIRRYTIGPSLKLADEPGQPATELFVPSLLISSGNYAEMYQYYTRKAQQMVDGASPEIALTARKIAAGKNNPDEIIEALENYVYKHITKIDLPLKDMLATDFSLPQTTMQDGYGNSVDRAILLAAMLKALDINYTFIPVSGEAFTLKSMEQLQQFPKDIFREMLIKVHRGDTIINDAGFHAPCGTMHHDGFLFLDNGELEPVNAILISNYRRVLCDIKVNADLSARITLITESNGTDLEAIREQFAKLNTQTVRQYFEKYAAGISPQAEIVESKFENDRITLTLEIPDFVKHSGKFAYLPLPEFSRLTSMAAIPANKRQTPYFNSRKRQIMLDYAITVPENFRLIPPDDINFNSFGTFLHTEYLYLLYSGKHLFGFAFGQDPAIFSPDAFELLREMNRQINHFFTKNVLFITE